MRRAGSEAIIEPGRATPHDRRPGWCDLEIDGRTCGKTEALAGEIQVVTHKRERDRDSAVLMDMSKIRPVRFLICVGQTGNLVSGGILPHPTVGEDSGICLFPKDLTANVQLRPRPHR